MVDEKDERWECPYCGYTLECNKVEYEAHVMAHKSNKKVVIDLAMVPTLDAAVQFTGFWTMGDLDRAYRYLRSAYASRYRVELIKQHKAHKGTILTSDDLESMKDE